MKKNIFLPILAAVVMIVSAAKADDKYMVDVNVDVTAEDASKAREKAMTDANRNAFLQVVKRNTTPLYVEKFADFSNEQILNFIKEVEVSEEKSSSVRYAAKLKILVDGDLLLAYMKENSIPMQYSDLTNVVIVPVYQLAKNGEPYLWEEENLWRNAWKNKGPVQSGDVVFRVIDDSFAQKIGINNVMYPNIITLAKIADNNPNTKVYVAKMRPDAFNYLNIEVINLQNEKHSALSIYGSPSERNLNIAADMLIARIKSDLNAQEQSEPKKQNIAGEINIFYSYKNLSDLVDAEKNLAKLPEIQKINLATMAAGKARFVAQASCSPENLLYAFSKAGFSVENRENSYIISKGNK